MLEGEGLIAPGTMHAGYSPRGNSQSPQKSDRLTDARGGMAQSKRHIKTWSSVIQRDRWTNLEQCGTGGQAD